MEGWVWFTLAGLVSDIAGAVILVSGLLITEEKAIELTALPDPYPLACPSSSS